MIDQFSRNITAKITTRIKLHTYRYIPLPHTFPLKTKSSRNDLIFNSIFIYFLCFIS